jgi:hypothetical protein
VLGVNSVCNHPWFWLLSIQLILNLIFRSKTRIRTRFFFSIIQPKTNTQIFYLGVDLKMGTEIYTCLWKKWLEPGVDSDPMYQTDTGIDPVLICFWNWNWRFLHKSKNPPDTGENRSMTIHNPQNSGQFHFHHWTKSISTARLQTPLFIKSCSTIG